jgi:hypothetical protein
MFGRQGYTQRTQNNALMRKSYSTDFYQFCTPVLKNRCSWRRSPVTHNTGCLENCIIHVTIWAGIVRSVKCLTTDWTTGVRSQAEAKDLFQALCADQLWGPLSGYRGFFPGGKARPGRNADHSPRLAPKLMSRSYTFSPPWRLHGGSATVLLSFAFTRNHRLGNSALKLTMMALSIARFFSSIMILLDFIFK